jgi:DNA-binding GntR family transcriptional regulator
MVLSVEDREFENPGIVLAEHEAILSAIRSRHADRAVREVRVHIETNAATSQGDPRRARVTRPPAVGPGRKDGAYGPARLPPLR